MRDPRLDVSGVRWVLVIGAGTFATTLAQSGTLDLPLRNLLTGKFDVVQLDPCGEATGSLHTISQFFGIVAFPWYFKFVVGVFSDSIPLFGTMRRHYVLLSATAAAALWFLAGQMQHSYLSLLAVITAMETMLVVCSTVMGALLVEVGQRLDAAGRLAGGSDCCRGDMRRCRRSARRHPRGCSVWNCCDGRGRCCLRGRASRVRLAQRARNVRSTRCPPSWM